MSGKGKNEAMNLRSPDEYDQFRRSKVKGTTKPGERCGTFICKTTETRIAGRRIMVKIHENDEFVMLRIGRWVTKRIPSTPVKKYYEQTYCMYPTLTEVARAVRIFCGSSAWGFEIRKPLTRMERIQKKYAEVLIPKDPSKYKFPSPEPHGYGLIYK